MPNSYSFYPAFDERKPTVPKWKLDGVSLVVDGDAGVEAAEPSDFDPGDHNAADVKAYVEEHPGERAAVLAAEQAGKNRVRLTDWLSTDGS